MVSIKIISLPFVFIVLVFKVHLVVSSSPQTTLTAVILAKKIEMVIYEIE